MLPVVGHARRLAQCWERCVGCQRQQVGGTVWCRWGRARNRPLMSLRSPASLGAGPHHPIHLLMDDSDTQTHIVYECITQTHTCACLHTGGLCKNTCDHDICTHKKLHIHAHTHTHTHIRTQGWTGYISEMVSLSLLSFCCHSNSGAHPL